MNIAPAVSTPPCVIPGPNGQHADIPNGPIGVGRVATLHVGYALNGVAFKDMDIMAPLTEPVATFKGSYADAVRGAQQLLSKPNYCGTSAVGIFMQNPGEWLARSVYTNPAMMHALDTPVGTGGIASVEFINASRALVSLVTAKNEVLVHTAR